MPDFTKPLFARGNQMITLIAEAKAAGFMCAKLEVLGGAKYRCYFMKDFSGRGVSVDIPSTCDQDTHPEMRQVQPQVDAANPQPETVPALPVPEMEKVKSCPTTKLL